MADLPVKDDKAGAVPGAGEKETPGIKVVQGNVELIILKLLEAQQNTLVAILNELKKLTAQKNG